jgi:hypothetical protein
MSDKKSIHLCAAEIRARIDAKKSFWVGSASERATALEYILSTKAHYRTGKDDRGGFFVCYLPQVKIKK